MIPLDRNKIAAALRERLHGQVLSDDKTLARYATDLSIYEIQPLVVVVPQDLEDVVAAVRFAYEAGIPLTPRGGGTGTAGAALGRGILIQFHKLGPMNRILGFEEVAGEPQITVEPGLLHNDMQAFLRERGLFLPADPSSGGICLLGGNIATKASGPHALKHGSIDRYLRHLQFVTVEGHVVDTADEASLPRRIREGVVALRRDVLADESTVQRLQDRQNMKLASGYNLFTLIRHQRPGDLVAQLLVGSVGTLGVVTRATLRAEPYVEGHATTLVYFRDLDQAGEAVQHIKALGVAAIEIMNYRSLVIIRERYPDVEIPDSEAHMLMVEFEGEERHEQMARVEEMLQKKRYDLAGPIHTAEDESEQERLWKARKALFPTLRNYRPNLKALSVVNDVGVAERYLPALIRDLEAIFDRHELVAAIYGHAGSGNLHLRPLFDTTDPQLPLKIQHLADDVYEAVLRYDGTITAEHGMGRLRTPYLAKEWGKTIVGYMRRVKQAFDPQDMLNPEVMFSERGLTQDMQDLA